MSSPTPARSSAGSSRPTSWTSAVAPGPTSWRTGCTSSSATRPSRASSSTSSAASPRATRWPTASCPPSRCWATRPPSRWSSASTATTSRRAGASSPRRTTRWSPWSTPWTAPHAGPPSSPPPEPQTGLREMSIFLNENSKVIVQGMTGSEGMKHTQRMLASGTAIVGGVNPRKAGQSVDFDGTSVPVFGGVSEAMKETGADVSVIFVPPAYAKDAVIEAVDAQIGLAVVITEGIPVHDSTFVWAHAQGGSTRIIGPNCPGLISPGRSNAGIIPANITKQGAIGLVSKSGTLTYQMMYELRDIGFSTAVGIGGDPVIGTTHIDCLKAFQDDPETEAIVMIGEIGGDAEARAADFVKANVTKPDRKSGV